MKPFLSILLPVRNEGINLKIMLKMLRGMLDFPHELIVVYDEPGDDSIEVVQSIQSEHKNLKLIHNQLGRGVVNAIRAGVQASTGEFVLIFAADEVGPVLAIEEMVQLAKEGCDFISCTRYAYGGRRLGGSLIGGILSRTANWLFHKCTGAVLSDSTTGIKMFRRSLFNEWKLQAPPVGWVVTFELAILAQISGVKLGEVPIISIDRLYGGKSTFQLGPWVIEYFKWFVKGAYALFKARKTPSPVQRKLPHYQKAA